MNYTISVCMLDEYGDESPTSRMGFEDRTDLLMILAHHFDKPSSDQILFLFDQIQEYIIKYDQWCHNVDTHVESNGDRFNVTIYFSKS